MADEKSNCPHCGEAKERRAIPFNPDEGVALVCKDCLRELSLDCLESLGVAELQKLANDGYFAHERFGYLKAVEGFNRYVRAMKDGGPKPFEVTGSLIIANECSSS